ncbi:MAG: MarR family winged helix-turn-helix transcriptional regulator [Anaerovoracaceae bacterium]
MSEVNNEKPKKTKVMPQLMRLNMLMDAHREADMTEEKRTGRDILRALKVIDGKGKISVRELNFILQVPPPVMRKLMEGLEKDELVNVEHPDPEKPRKRVVSLTEKGKERAAEKPEGPGKIFSVLSDEEKVQLSGLLSKVSDNLASELGLPEDRKEQMKILREKERERRPRGPERKRC